MDIPVRRVQAALHALDAAETTADAAALPAAVLPGLAESVGADVATWTEDGPPRRVLTLQRRRTHDDGAAAFTYAVLHVPYARGPTSRRVITLELVGANGTGAHVTFCRSASDFDTAEVELLEGLRPLLSRRLTALTRITSARQALSLREQEVLDLVATGLTDAAIGHRLGCRPRTVDKHLEHAYRALGVGNRAAAVARWLREGEPPAHSGGTTFSR